MASDILTFHHFVYKGFGRERRESELRRAGSLRQRCYKAIFSGHVRALALYPSRTRLNFFKIIYKRFHIGVFLIISML